MASLHTIQPSCHPNRTIPVKQNTKCGALLKLLGLPQYYEEKEEQKEEQTEKGEEKQKVEKQKERRRKRRRRSREVELVSRMCLKRGRKGEEESLCYI